MINSSNVSTRQIQILNVVCVHQAPSSIQLCYSALLTVVTASPPLLTKCYYQLYLDTLYTWRIYYFLTLRSIEGLFGGFSSVHFFPALVIKDPALLWHINLVLTSLMYQLFESMVMASSRMGEESLGS